MKAEWFGPRLRELRERAGLTQQQLADACAPRMTREGVAQLETGRNRPAWATVIASRARPPRASGSGRGRSDGRADADTDG